MANDTPENGRPAMAESAKQDLLDRIMRKAAARARTTPAEFARRVPVGRFPSPMPDTLPPSLEERAYEVAEIDRQAQAMKEAIKAVRAEGKCTFVVKCTKLEREDGVGFGGKRPCGALQTRGGFCRVHYNLKVLKVLPRQVGSGRSRGYRPFDGTQLPGNMTDIQHECLRRLPRETPYEECLRLMSDADPNNILKPLSQKPGLRKTRGY